MKSHVSMSRIYRLVWSQSLGVIVAGVGFEEAP